MGELSVSTVAFQSHKDELVTNRSRKVLEKIPQIRIQDLFDSSHFYYTQEDREIVISAFHSLCEEMKKHD